MIANGYEVSFWGDKIALALASSEYTKNPTEWYTLGCVNKKKRMWNLY